MGQPAPGQRGRWADQESAGKPLRGTKGGGEGFACIRVGLNSPGGCMNTVGGREATSPSPRAAKGRGGAGEESGCGQTGPWCFLAARKLVFPGLGMVRGLGLLSPRPLGTQDGGGHPARHLYSYHSRDSSRHLHLPPPAPPDKPCLTKATP